MINLKPVIFSLLFVLSSYAVNGQINASEIIQESKIASAQANKLYYVDFWATWCAPCIHAKKYLTVLQKQFPKDFHIISLTVENSDRVERFLKKTPSELTVAIDYYGETFKTYKIKPLPDGILFNAKGEKLWQGHPGDLKPEHIQRYINQSNKRTNLKDFVKVITDYDEEIDAVYIPQQPLEIKQINSNYETLSVNDYDTHLKLQGPLKSIVSYLSHTYKEQIDISSDLNLPYEVYVKKPIDTSVNLGYQITQQLGYTIETKKTEGETLTLKLNDTSLLWDTNQIDWGSNTAKFIIGDTDITADNVSIKKLSYQLSTVLDLPVLIAGDDMVKSEPHDWQVHYKFFNLMKTSLKDYGVTVEKSIQKYDVYKIIKAP